MYLLNLTEQILRDMWQHKLRSILALFGIVWGTITVVLLLALGNGFTTASRSRMMGIVDGSFFMVPAKTSQAYRGIPEGRSINIKAPDVMNLSTIFPDIVKASPMLVRRTRITYRHKQLNKEIFGVSSDFGYLQKVILAQGRFINKLDVTKKAFVMVLGYQVKQQLFGRAEALGKKVTFNHIKFTVIGVTPEPQGHVYKWYRNKVIIPYTTYINLFGNSNCNYFIVLPNENADSATVKNSLLNYLARRYHFSPQDKAAMTVFDTTKIFQFIRWFFIGIQLFLGLCGTLTLGVGSLGVANIMFLIVNERTREIGVRMALGARAWHILWQVMLEGLVIVSCGALIGFVASYATVTILQHINLPDWLGTPVISTGAVIATVVVLAILGIFAGFFPARRAANMDPVDALGGK